MNEFVTRQPAKAERAARRLEESDAYRILRQIPDVTDIWCRSSPVPPPGDRIVIGVVDTESTGLDPTTDELIEIALVRMTISRSAGDLLDIERPVSWLREPSRPLSQEIEQLTGLTHELLAGREFDDDEIVDHLESVTLLAMHNARHDMAFLRARFPSLDLPAACTLSELDWSPAAFGRSVGGLLAGAGLFASQAHRAADDAHALAVLLALQMPDGRCRAAHLFDRARRPTARLFAERAPISVKGALKCAGYRWDVRRRAWWIEGEPERIANEVGWLRALHPAIVPRTEPRSWRNRWTS